jgi:hypothetical protein
MILNTQNSSKTASLLSLNPTFFMLASGVATIEDVIAQHRATRARILETEDDYMPRRQQLAEADPFGMTHYL